MQCPDCGNDVDDSAVFCPHCRYRFQESDDTAFDSDVPASAAQMHDTDESLFEDRYKAFSARELRILELQLMEPAVLVVIVISLFVYTLISGIPFIPLTISGLSIGVTGIICLACGIVAGFVFFVISRRSLQKFRYR